MSVPSKPPAPLVGKVTHHSIELSWSEALTLANDSGRHGDSRVRVCVQEQDSKTNAWDNVYSGYAKRHVLNGLEPLTLYTYRIRFMSDEGNSEFSATTSVSTCKPPLTGEHLFSAIDRNDPLGIERIMESKEVHIEVTNKHGFTPLMVASGKGYTDCVVELLRRGAEVDNANDSGKTALMQACFFGKLECVETLREAGANYTLQDKGGSTALHWAVDGGHIDVIGWMLDDGADVNIKTGDSLWSPLLRNAAVKGCPKVAKLLLENGANIDDRDVDGKTPLMMAVINGHTDLVDLLLNNDADLNAQNEFGKTIYEMALTMEKRMVIKTLEDFMIKKNLLDADHIHVHRSTTSIRKT